MADHEIEVSSARTAFDRVMAETFFATMKTELLYCRPWLTRDELETEAFPCLEGFYNPRRRHCRHDDLGLTDDEQQLQTPKRRPPGGGHFTNVILCSNVEVADGVNADFELAYEGRFALL